jgi:hypothetical protein
LSVTFIGYGEVSMKDDPYEAAMTRRNHFQCRASEEARSGTAQAVVVAFREMLDALVSNRMRRAAAEAGHVRVRQFRPGYDSPPS